MELRQPPVSINDPTGTGTVDGTNPFSGILDSILGDSPEAQKARIEEASQNAKDLTNLVRRKKPANGDAGAMSEHAPAGSGKRKVDQVEDETSTKKAKRTET